MGQSEVIFEATNANFQETVLAASLRQPVLVDFWAGWCGPCKILMPLLEKIVQDYGGRILLAKVDTEANQALAAQFGIRSIPTVILFKNGTAVDAFSGAVPEAQIRVFIDNHLPGEADERLAEAAQAFQRGEHDTGLALIRQAMELAPGRLPILRSAATLMIEQHHYQEAAAILQQQPLDIQLDATIAPLLARLSFLDILAHAPSLEEATARQAANPEDCSANYILAAHHALAGRYESAMELLLNVMGKNPRFENGVARKAMITIFEILGNTGELVHHYRSRMSRLLL
ncbi:MAG: thioredoxin [Pseudomonadota bacterium]